ncbi:MAG: translation elongation factor Ts [Lachnospiraceae bacterium]|nr:translation elongation factor Ts [Lachnospiraceae bacterium]
MAISAKQVKELREISGAGMMDCKKALTETDGDMDKAVEWLRENGLAKAAKKADRIAAEGMVSINIDASGKKASIVEVNSETDFVAKNEKFQTYVKDVACQVMNSSATDIDTFMAEKWQDSDVTVDDNNKAMIAVIGENLKIRRFERVETTGLIGSYIHNGGKIGVIVEVDTDSDADAVKQAIEMIAMQVCSMNPKYLSDADVDQDWLNSEKEVLRAQINNDPKEASKPDKVKEGMIAGRIKKQLKEVCLLDQAYVFAEDGKQSVKQYCDSVAKDNGCKFEIKSYIRFETGEGIEKKSEDFAAEVAAQMQ